MATQITTNAELQAMNVDPSADYVLANDLDWSEAEGDFTPVGYLLNPNGLWSGSFDGQGYTIHNLTIDFTSDFCAGLFGYSSTGGSISNLRLVNPAVVGSGGNFGHVGAIVGVLAAGNISNCCVVGGSVSGYDGAVGGLLGQGGTGTVSNCYCTADVTCTDGHEAGGISGDTSTVSRCWTSGTISCPSGAAGGIVGFHTTPRTISDCFSVATVMADGPVNAGYIANHVTGDTPTNCWWVQQAGDTATQGTDAAVLNEETNISDLFDKTHDVYTAGIAWDFSAGGDWQELNGAFPILAYEPTPAAADAEMSGIGYAMGMSAHGQDY